jgi:glucokinase
MSNYLGIEIGGTKLLMVVGDDSARIIHRWRANVDRAAGGPGIRRQVEQGIAELTTTFRPAAIGVGFGGPIERQTGAIHTSHQIEGWENFPLGQWLRELSKLPVNVDNDANVGALGESLSGAGRGASPVFYTTLGSGVGGGMTLDGQIYHGDIPGECEIGHVRLDRHGATVESRCSGWAIDARIRALCSADSNSILRKLIGDTPDGEAKHLPAALLANDPIAIQILRELSDDLAFAFSHVIHLLHPKMLILGGGLSLVGEPLRAAIANAIPTYLMKAFAPGPTIALAALGEDAVPSGALHLAAQLTTVY